MEQYDNIILFVLKTVIIGNAILFGIIISVLIVSNIFKNKLNYKKINNVCLTLLICGLIEFSFFAIPRLIDLKTHDYVVLNDASISVSAMNEFDGSFLVYGIGQVKDSDGNSITLTGTELINLPTNDSPHQVLRGTVVYGKYSKQIVDYKKD